MRRAAALALLLATAAAGRSPGRPADDAGPSVRRDPRVEQVVWMRCRSEIGSEEITLFGNGTARLRVEADGESALRLGELTRDELEAYRRRLAEIDLKEAESVRFGAVGEWVEQCELRLARGDGTTVRYRFGRYDTLGLALSRVVRIVEELGREARARDTDRGLPVSYAPREGDILVRADGERFEVVRRTGDGLGVELLAVDGPLLLYVPIGQIRAQFVGIEPRDGER